MIWPSLPVLLCLSLGLLGCAGSGAAVSSPADPNLPIVSQTLSGRVMDGQQAIAGAHVYLLAANTTGYGNASASLLLAESTGYWDSVGAYALTGTDGGFSIAGTYSCAIGNQQVYLYVQGGNAGLGVNPAIGELADLGDCPSLTAPTVPSLVVNEVTTIAAAYAMSGFASNANNVSSSGTVLAQIDVRNAFANAGNLASISTGTALSEIPSGNATVPQATLNTLANILAACIHSPSSASSTCTNLLSNTEASGVEPTNTATAAINIAHSPAANIAALYALQTASSPYSPNLGAMPNDFSIGLQFTTFSFYANGNLAIDGSGSVWRTNSLNTVTVTSSSGSLLSGSNGYTDGLYGPRDLAIDLSGNVWIGNYAAVIPSSSNPYSLFEISNEGGLLSGTGYTGGGLYDEGDMAIDGTGNVWAVNDSSVSKFSPSGVALSGSGFTGGGMHVPIGIAIDGTGNAWVGNLGSNVIKLSSSGIILSGTNGFTDGGTRNPYGVAIDSSGNVWAAYPSGATGTTGRIVKFSNAGAVLSGSTGFTANGTINPYYIAIDGGGNVWAPNSQGNSVAELSSAGEVLSGPVGYTGGILGDPFWIAVDGSGDVWVTNASFTTTAYQVTELIGIATPVITPICAGLPASPTVDGSSKLGTRP